MSSGSPSAEANRIEKDLLTYHTERTAMLRGMDPDDLEDLESELLSARSFLEKHPFPKREDIDDFVTRLLRDSKRGNLARRSSTVGVVSDELMHGVFERVNARGDDSETAFLYSAAEAIYSAPLDCDTIPTLERQMRKQGWAIAAHVGKGREGDEEAVRDSLHLHLFVNHLIHASSQFFPEEKSEWRLGISSRTEAVSISWDSIAGWVHH